jgi:hypothetical protein
MAWHSIQTYDTIQYTHTDIHPHQTRFSGLDLDLVLRFIPIWTSFSLLLLSISPGQSSPAIKIKDIPDFPPTTAPELLASPHSLPLVLPHPSTHQDQFQSLPNSPEAPRPVEVVQTTSAVSPVLPPLPSWSLAWTSGRLVDRKIQ